MQSYQVHFTLWVIKSNQLKKQTLKFQKIQVLESKMSYFNVDDNHILQSLEKINTLQVKRIYSLEKGIILNSKGIILTLTLKWIMIIILFNLKENLGVSRKKKKFFFFHFWLMMWLKEFCIFMAK